MASFLRLVGDLEGIRGLLFHTVFLNEDEIASSHILPQQKLIVDHYRWIFEYFLKNGYRFLGYSDLARKLSPREKYIYVTFDDGYYNNLRIIPLIEELEIPIHLFVTTQNILDNRKFWWDVVYQKRRAAGAEQQEINGELAVLRQLPQVERESRLIHEFGAGVFEPLSDLDRPLTPIELLGASNHHLVTIGNHTRSHQIITNLTAQQVQAEVTQCGEDIRSIIGRSPSGFAFPNGDYRQEDIALLKSLGIDLIFSCDPKNNKISNGVEGQLLMGRYCFSGNNDLKWQAEMVRAGASPFFLAQQLRSSLDK